MLEAANRWLKMLFAGAFLGYLIKQDCSNWMKNKEFKMGKLWDPKNVHFDMILSHGAVVTMPMQ